MNRSFLAALMVFICLSVIFWLLISYRKQSLSADPSSFIPITGEWKKRSFDLSRRQEDINGYPESVYAILHATEEENLVAISCSSTFIRNWESLFFLRNQTNLKYTISMPHQTMIEWLTPLELGLPNAFRKGKKFLLGRLCRTDAGITWFEYHRGVQEQFFDDYVTLGNSINTYIFISKDENQYQNAIDITKADRGPIFHCMPMQMTKKGLLYYQCTEIQHGDATTWFYGIDTTKEESALLATCTYRYTKNPTRECY